MTKSVEIILTKADKPSAMFFDQECLDNAWFGRLYYPKQASWLRLVNAINTSNVMIRLNDYYDFHVTITRI